MLSPSPSSPPSLSILQRMNSIILSWDSLPSSLQRCCCCSHGIAAALWVLAIPRGHRETPTVGASGAVSFLLYHDGLGGDRGLVLTPGAGRGCRAAEGAEGRGRLGPWAAWLGREWCEGQRATGAAEQPHSLCFSPHIETGALRAA